MDATGRPFSAGLMDGTITDFGSFDQCIGLHIPLVFNSVGGVDKMNSAYKPNEMKQIRGQYCMVQYNVFLPPRPKHLNLQTRIFNFTNTPIEGTVSCNNRKYYYYNIEYLFFSFVHYSFSKIFQTLFMFVTSVLVELVFVCPLRAQKMILNRSSIIVRVFDFDFIE